jgi:hypothetical protein
MHWEGEGRLAAHSCGLHEQPSRRRHDPDRSPNSPADRLSHILGTEQFWAGGAVALPGVPRRIDQGRGGDSRDVIVGGRCVVALPLEFF